MPEQEDGVSHSPKFLVALALILVLAAIVLIKPFLAAVVLALLFAFILHRPFEMLARVVRWRSVAAGIVVVLFLLAIIGPVAFILMALARDVGVVIELAQNPARVEAAIARVLAPFGVERSDVPMIAGGVVERAAGFVQDVLLDMITRAAYVVAGLVIFVFVLFFGLRDGEAALAGLQRYVPLRERAKAHLLDLVAQRTRAIALGAFLVGLVQGVAGGLAWWFFGFPAPAFWGFVITVFALLPFGPPFLIMAPAGVIAILNGDYFSGVGIIVYAAVVVGLVDDLLRPYLIGRQSGVHPAIILVGTLGGLVVFGVSGFVLGPLLLGMVGPVLEVWASERARSEATAGD